jgi:glutaredoxin
MTAPARLTLYSKPGCHLCDDMKQVIEEVAVRVPLTLDVVDISADPALMDRYELEIPVLLIDGKKAAKYRLTERELEEKLRRSKGPAEAGPSR